jgi:hypothetical protein
MCTVLVDVVDKCAQFQFAHSVNCKLYTVRRLPLFQGLGNHAQFPSSYLTIMHSLITRTWQSCTVSFLILGNHAQFPSSNLAIMHSFLTRTWQSCTVSLLLLGNHAQFPSSYSAIMHSFLPRTQLQGTVSACRHSEYAEITAHTWVSAEELNFFFNSLT